MTYTTPETRQDTLPPAGQIEQETKERLAKAKAEISPDTPIPQMLRDFFRDFKSLSHKEKLERIGAIIFAITLGKLGVKGKAKEQESAEKGATTESGTPATEKPQEPEVLTGKKGDPTPVLPAIDKAKYQKGDLLPAVINLFPGIEVQGGTQVLSTSTAKRNGVPKWNGKSTDDWDYRKAGNTDEGIEKGEYHIQAVSEPSGYTRTGTDLVPPPTLKKLVRIAELLRADPRMRLFTGIAMTVDGIQVMMVKEIHMHPMSEYGKKGLSDHYYQPHTGVSYIMKKA